MKRLKSTGILLVALALAACENNDHNPAPHAGLLPITTGTAGIEATTRYQVPTLPHTGGEITLYTPADEEKCTYNLSAGGILSLKDGETPPVGYINSTLTAHAYGTVDATETNLGSVFVRTNATAHPVREGAEVDEARIGLVLAPATARIRIKVEGCYGESAAENEALAPTITLNPDIFEKPDYWYFIPNPGDDFLAELAPNAYPVSAFTGTSPQLIPTTIAAGQSGNLLTLSFADNDSSPYAGRTYTVLIPAGGITLEAAQTNVYTVSLKGGGQAAITDVQIVSFENEGNTEWRTHDKGIHTAADLAAFAAEWNTVAPAKDYFTSITPEQKAVLARWGVENQETGLYVITLHNDITLTGEWTPIKNFNHAEFDGAGHTIRGLVVNQSSGDNIGLFARVMLGARVSHLAVDAPQLTGNYTVGAIAGSNQGHITACTVTGGNIIVTGQAGGITGSNSFGRITACTATGVTVTATDSQAGGIAGVNDIATITSCIVTAGTISASRYVGAIIGNNASTITACYRHATAVTVTGSNQNTDGTAFTDPADIDIAAMNAALDALDGDPFSATPYRWKAGAGTGSYPVVEIP